MTHSELTISKLWEILIEDIAKVTSLKIEDLQKCVPTFRISENIRCHAIDAENFKTFSNRDMYRAITFSIPESWMIPLYQPKTSAFDLRYTHVAQKARFFVRGVIPLLREIGLWNTLQHAALTLESPYFVGRKHDNRLVMHQKVGFVTADFNRLKTTCYRDENELKVL